MTSKIEILLERIAVALERKNIVVKEEEEEEIDTLKALQLRADYNREHAGEKYGKDMYYSNDCERWHLNTNDRHVVFTPYGWREDEYEIE